MRFLPCVTASLLGAAWALAQPPAASAEGDKIWQACVGTATLPNEKVTACSAVIDEKKETGKRPAPAHCFHPHVPIANRQLDSPPSHHYQSILPHPPPPLPVHNP